MLGSVLLLDEDTQCLRHGAAPSLPDFYNKAVDGIQIGPTVGSCGTAAYRGQRVVVEDVMTDRLWANYRDLAAQAELRACWSQPIRSASGQTLGTFAMYYREPHAPTAIDLELIDSAADLASVAIEHKRAEQAVREARDELELRVQQRTEELARSNAALEESNRELQQFAYIASHDLQEPLRMVASYCDLLKRRYHGQLDEDADDFINFALDGAARMQTLIRDLLEYSRLQTEARPYEDTDCGTLVADVIKNLAVSIQAAGATVTFDSLPTVTGSPSQLAAVFQNLIENAIKYHGPEPPNVHVSAERKNEQCVFAVRDNGIGIDARHIDRIFTVFRRLHSHDEIPGTGIGLAICKRAVERHGGQIWAESQLGGGSTFYFTIPLR
jgi:signal transduction histidine kinase